MSGNLQKLRLFHTVADAQGNFDILWKDYELTFVPWVGLEICDYDVGFNGSGYTISKLIWSDKLKSFVGQTTGEQWGKSDNTEEIQLEIDQARDDHVNYMLSLGWSNEDVG